MDVGGYWFLCLWVGFFSSIAFSVKIVFSQVVFSVEVFSGLVFSGRVCLQRSMGGILPLQCQK